MPEKVQEKMPDRISDRLSEYMSHRMAAYLSLFFLSHQLPVSGDHSKNSSEIHLVVSLPLSAISFFMCMHGLGPHCAPNSAVLCHISDMCPWVLYVRHILHMSLTMPCRKRAGLEAWMSIYTYVGTNVRQLAALMPFYLCQHICHREKIL